MNMLRRINGVVVLILALVCTSMSAANIKHIPAEGADAAKGIAALVVVDRLVFPSGVYGTKGTAGEQVDEIVTLMHQRLAADGLGIGSMLQHTIYLRDGAIQPMEVLNRFHAAATKLAPSLKAHPSVGTILRVPELPDKNAMVMVDVVAGKPAKKGPDGFVRIPFTFGPQEIVESIGVDKLVFSAGMEGMDFEHGTLAPTIDEQIVAIVGKINTAMKSAGLTVGHMVSHNLYVTQGTDPMRVIQKFHEETQKYSPELKKHQSVGTLAIVDGMAVPGFLLEVDVVAARPQPERLKRVPFTEVRMDIAKTVAVDDLIFVCGMEGVDFDKRMAVSPDVLEQAEVAAKKIHSSLRQSGLSIGNVVKQKLYVVKGADVERVRTRFHETAIRLAPEVKSKPPAETVIVVEGLAGASLKFEVTAIAARTP
jgi:enamine deaminase RidA (YjgF/YER057c/UK114 family)